jgi:hypothetical protein
MKEKIRVYIASPYSIGDQASNVRTQIDMGYQLLKMGYIPYIPELYHFVHLVHPLTYDEVMEIGLSWLKMCDCVLRLSGESKGADIEVEYGLKLGKKIFYNLQELDDWYKTSWIKIEKKPKQLKCQSCIHGTKGWESPCDGGSEYCTDYTIRL